MAKVVYILKAFIDSFCVRLERGDGGGGGGGRTVSRVAKRSGSQC